MADEAGDIGAVGATGDGASGSEQMAGESVEAYLARLKAMGLYGGDITNQPKAGSGTPGFGTPSIPSNIAPSGYLPGYDKPRAAGQTSDTGSGQTTSLPPKASGLGSNGTGTGMGATIGESGGYGMLDNNWKSDPSSSKSVGGGGGGSGSAFIPAGNHLTQPSVFFPGPGGSSGGGGGGGGAFRGGGGGDVGQNDNAMGNFNYNPFVKIPSSTGNALLALQRMLDLQNMQYVKPSYINQLNPFTAPSMAAGQAPMAQNYLSQVMRGR